MAGSDCEKLGQSAQQHPLKMLGLDARSNGLPMFHTKQNFFTLAACRLGVQQLLRYQNVDVPVLATTPKDTWVEQQAKLVMLLCSRSRKNCGSARLRTLSYRQVGLMDWDQTMPMQAGFAAPSWSCSCFVTPSPAVETVLIYLLWGTHLLCEIKGQPIS